MSTVWPEVQVPEDWRPTRLKYVFEFERNGTWGEDPTGDDNDVLCIRVADFDRSNFTVRETAATIRNVLPNHRLPRLLRPGDVLLEKSGGSTDKPVGCAVMVESDVPAVCSNFVAILRPRPELNARFVGLLMASLYQERLNQPFVKQTTGIQNLDSAQYLAQWVNIPQRDEQNSIVEHIDNETARVDELIAEQERLLYFTQEHYSAAIDREVWHKVKVTIPLGRLTPPGRSIMYGIVLPGPSVEQGVSIVKGGDVKPERLSPEKLAKTTHEIEEPFARARLRANDVVYAIRGSIGDAELVPSSIEGANITQDVARIAPGPGIDPRWLLYAVRSHRFFSQMESEARGATIRGLNIWTLKRGRVPHVGQLEQNRVAARLDDLTKRVETTIDEVGLQITLLWEHRRAIIAAATAGGIGSLRGVS